MLAVEEVAERRLRPQLHRRVSLWEHIRRGLEHMDCRFAERPTGPARTLDDGGLLRECVQIGRGFRRRERTEVHRGRHAREQTGGGDHRVLRREIRVKPSERAERLRLSSLVFRTARPSLELKRTCPVCSKNSRPATRGPPRAYRGLNSSILKLRNRPRLFRTIGARRLSWKRQRSPARLV